MQSEYSIMGEREGGGERERERHQPDRKLESG